MKLLTCKNCGGAMALDTTARSAVCLYCGATHVLNREDTDYYHDFHMQMLRFLTGTADEVARRQQAEELWKQAQVTAFMTKDGQRVQASHLYELYGDVADMYVCRSSILFHFHSSHPFAMEQYRKMTSALDYPSADVRGLADFFPRVIGGYELADGTDLLAIAKDEDEYPLSLFGTLSPRHTAWVLSRLENIACVLEFSDIVHGHIDPDTVFINPYTHQACLYGGWWHAAKKNGVLPDNGGIARMSENLVALRRTGAHLLGFSSLSHVTYRDTVPTALTEFLTSFPADTAYEDFARWDETIEKAFGERRFIRMDVDDEQIYKQKG